MTWSRNLRWDLMLMALVGIAAIVSSRLSPYFLDTLNLVSAAEFYVIFALMALGLAPVVVTGEIDISLASTLAVASVTFATLADAGVPIVIGLMVVLAVGAGLGMVNGVLVASLGLPSLAVTLGTLGAYRGVAYLLAGDAGVIVHNTSYHVIGRHDVGPVPLSLLLVVAVAVVIGLLMAITPFGRYAYAIGNGAGASRLAGVPIRRTKIAAFTLAGALAGLAGTVWVGQYQAARGDNADGTILFVVTAVVLGGVSIKGGSGRASGVFLALLVLATLQTGMRLANIPGTSQTLVVGGLLILSIGLPNAAALVRPHLQNLRSARLGRSRAQSA